VISGVTLPYVLMMSSIAQTFFLILLFIYNDIHIEILKLNFEHVIRVWSKNQVDFRDQQGQTKDNNEIIYSQIQIFRYLDI
jgi:hypothetical protein